MTTKNKTISPSKYSAIMNGRESYKLRHMRKQMIATGDMNKFLDQEIIRTGRVIEAHKEQIIKLMDQLKTLQYDYQRGLDKYLEITECFELAKSNYPVKASDSR